MLLPGSVSKAPCQHLRVQADWWPKPFEVEQPLGAEIPNTLQSCHSQLSGPCHQEAMSNHTDPLSFARAATHGPKSAHVGNQVRYIAGQCPMAAENTTKITSFDNVNQSVHIRPEAGQ